MSIWFRYGFMVLTISMMSMGCERAAYREAREEEERFGSVDHRTGPEQPSLEDQINNDE